jgi:PTH1 family peptidyl-tRNA hydrolase
MSDSSPATVQCIVGLGNPGPTYAETRHNAGVWFIQALCNTRNIQLTLNSRLRAYCGQMQLGSQTVYLLVPNVFMNHSGQVVRSFLQYYKIPPENCLIIHDELDLPNGLIRAKQGGGHGGHNGLRDIVQQLSGQSNFYRLRIGIGRPAHPGHAVADFVLAKPSIDEKIEIERAIEQTLPHIDDMVAGHWDKAMQQLHTKI